VIVGVIGTGNMGSALVKGWLRAPGAAPDLIVWDKVAAAAQRLREAGPVSVAGSLEELVARADVVLIVVKPKDAGAVLGAIGPLVREDQVVVSAMAGIMLGWMRGILGPRPGLFRIMPNLGVELGEGAIAVASEPAAPDAALRVVVGLLEPLGLVEVVSEDMFDAVTAVSGSGPAFLAVAVESLEDGAVAAGLSRVLARRLVRQAALAMARLLPLYADSPGELGADLASIGDLDPAVMGMLEERGVRSAFQQAVEAAAGRGRELRDVKRS
jgi:pyrroline-5-carboxylate reductase